MGEKAGMDWGESGSDGSLEEVGGKESIFRKYCVKKKSIFNKNVALWFV